MNLGEAFIAVDPGKSGAAALFSWDGNLIKSMNYHRPIEMAESVACWVEAHDARELVIEKVGAFPGQGVVSCFSFGFAAGWWYGLADTHALKITEVLPRTWQKTLSLPGHTTKRDHKNALKDLAAKTFPNVKVTLANADALLIGRWFAEIRRPK